MAKDFQISKSKVKVIIGEMDVLFGTIYPFFF